MTLGRHGKRTPSLSGRELLASVGLEPDETSTVAFHDLFSMGSHEETLDQWLEIATAVAAVSPEPCVISHGSDSIAEAAYTIRELATDAQKVVLVPAMRPAGAVSADGPLNLGDAFVAVRADIANDVYVCANRQLWPAWAVAKRHTTALDAFAARSGGPIGRIHDHGVYQESGILRGNWLGEVPIRGAGVEATMVRLWPGMSREDANLFGKTSQASGIVVETFGGGSIPPYLRGDIRQAAEKLPIVLASGLPGPLLSEELYPAALEDVLVENVYVENHLDGSRARIRLSLMRALGRDYEPLALTTPMA